MCLPAYKEIKNRLQVHNIQYEMFLLLLVTFIDINSYVYKLIYRIHLYYHNIPNKQQLITAIQVQVSNRIFKLKICSICTMIQIWLLIKIHTTMKVTDCYLIFMLKGFIAMDSCNLNYILIFMFFFNNFILLPTESLRSHHIVILGQFRFDYIIITSN